MRLLARGARRGYGILGGEASCFSVQLHVANSVACLGLRLAGTCIYNVGSACICKLVLVVHLRAYKSEARCGIACIERLHARVQ